MAEKLDLLKLNNMSRANPHYPLKQAFLADKKKKTDSDDSSDHDQQEKQMVESKDLGEQSTIIGTMDYNSSKDSFYRMENQKRRDFIGSLKRDDDFKSLFSED